MCVPSHSTTFPSPNFTCFTYPTVFEKFVRFDSQDAQDRVTDDLNTAKEEAAKLENLRKLFMAEQAKKRKLEKAAKAAKKR